jgi:hypothetical protein
MCKPKPGAPTTQRVIVYTVDSPFSKEKPGFIAAQQGASDGEVVFTSDMWLAMAKERPEWEKWLPMYQSRSKKQMYTHEAFVAFVKP